MASTDKYWELCMSHLIQMLAPLILLEKTASIAERLVLPVESISAEAEASTHLGFWGGLLLIHSPASSAKTRKK